jgi:dTDP-4-amino-4,6-dideoxygalactose transaminase
MNKSVAHHTDIPSTMEVVPPTTTNYGSLIGGLSSVSIVVLWLFTFHKKFFLSLLKTPKLNAYGVYTDLGEAIRSHFWFLWKGLFVTPDRAFLEAQVKETFLKELGHTDSTGHALLAHSCRSIFYGIIKLTLDRAFETKGEWRITIATPSVHFGSFYKLLRGMETSMNCTIDFYEIDLNENDWTLDEASIDEAEFSKCDLVLCQHLFGVPFDQDKLFELGKKYDIPIIEDCVQSGSLFGNYKGNHQSDVIMYSGGLDKTPQCFGAGMAVFRTTTPWGRTLYDESLQFHNQLPVDTWTSRLESCSKQLIHLMIATDAFGINNLLALIGYVWLSERGDYLKWYAIALKIRKNKAMTPFQHAASGFLKQPSVYQLQSIRYGLLGKKHHYQHHAQRELERRDLLLSSIPTQYHRILFPWWTTKVLQSHRDNRGICEFSWVVAPKDERMNLCQFLNDHFWITTINTTWEHHDGNTKNAMPVGKDINNRLVYLPNNAQLTNAQIVKLGHDLTKYCRSLD